MFTVRNFSKINNNIFLKEFFNDSKKIARKLRLYSIEPDFHYIKKKQFNITKSSCENERIIIKTKPEFNIKIIIKKNNVEEYVNDLIMRSSMML